MKLIKRTTLHYQKDSSDKVYEVDLCEVESDKYLVNFRYGRRGANLKEGTKTTQPVALREAQQVFDKLVGEKTKKGYIDISAASSPATVVQSVATDDGRKQAILNRLADDKPSTWKLERAIWRAGELKMKEATPLLINLLGTGEDLQDYCIAWALGWCNQNSNDKDVIAVLTKLSQSNEAADFVSSIAFEATLKVCDEEKKAELQAETIEYLPSFFQELLKKDSSDDFTTELKAYLADCDYQDFEILETIYEIDSEIVRSGLIDVISKAPLKPNYFQRLRHIFKIAEYRRDEEVFGILAYRFEKESGNFDSKRYVRLENGDFLNPYKRNYNQQTRRYENRINEVAEELKKPTSRIAYSHKTREYLLHRVWRALNKLGEESNPDYVKMAVGILLQYSDADGIGNYYRNPFAYYLTFNHILYENSPRYRLYDRKKWIPKRDYKPNDAEPIVREEAFPQLWEQQPEALLKLLVESECNPVHNFAVKALRTCHNFLASINIDTIIKLVNKPYEVTAQLGFELALVNYDSKNPNKNLVLALANCLSEAARKQAYKWIKQNQGKFLQDSSFIAGLVTSSQSETRQFAKSFLGKAVINESTAQVIVGKIIVELLSLSLIYKEESTEVSLPLLDKEGLGEVSLPLLDKEGLGEVSLPLLDKEGLGEVSLPLLDKEGLGEVSLPLLDKEGLGEVSLPLLDKEGLGEVSLPLLDKEGLGEVSLPLLDKEGLGEVSLPLLDKEGLGEVSLPLLDKEGLGEVSLPLLDKEGLGEVEISQLIKEASEILLITFTKQLRTLNLNVINDLLTHSIVEIQELGARILLNHQIPAKDLPAHIIESLLASENESLRVLGIRLFGQLPDDKLIHEEKELIIAICLQQRFAIAINPNSEIRNAIKPVINRLTAANPNFCIEIASDFIEILLTKEKHEGIHSFLVTLLKDLPPWMTSISKETTIMLLKAKSSPAQELGGLLLTANYQTWIEEFTASEIVKLGNHEVAAIRKASHQMLSQISNRLRADSQEMIAAVRMLEAKWQDSREFAFKLFTTEFGENEFTPEVLVTICDSVREEARRLGRDLLTRNFQSLDGEEYLLKFSEHPSADMQLFATNYLENYAKDDTEKLQQLAPFFISILSRVNRGSIAKKRTFTFLESEAQKSETAAKIVAEIMTRQSVTMAIADKSSAIQIMLKIHKNYPHLTLPIKIKPVVEVRS
ncbi:MAG: WGR domain-containing protein [Cyanobacteria bacterium J06635_10]